MFNIDKSLFKLLKYKKNDVIKNHGDICDSIGIVLSGSIKIIDITFYNKEFVIDILKTNELFGENLMFSSKNYYPGDLIAQTQTEIAFIDKNTFIKLLSDNHNFKIFYLSYISNKFIKLQKRLKILSQPSIEEKIIYFMQINQANGEVFIQSITELSNYLNIPRPSLSRSISKLIREGVIFRTGRKYIINQNPH